MHSVDITWCSLRSLSCIDGILCVLVAWICFFQTETSTNSFYHVCTEYQSIDGIDLN